MGKDYCIGFYATGSVAREPAQFIPFTSMFLAHSIRLMSERTSNMLSEFLQSFASMTCTIFLFNTHC